MRPLPFGLHTSRGEDWMILAHKIALDPTQAQAEYFARCSGVARFA